MKPTLYWHDYETTGVDPARDRPIQFAGIRTDEDLNIIGDPLVQYCQLPNDCLPHPQAALVTGITPQKACKEGLIEPQFIAAIHQELSQPGTCGVGYNSLRFDDEVTRFTLYRNFYDPYEREWKNGNSRWDIIDMLRLMRALRPQGINWPDNPDGTPSFRLETLSAANGIEHSNAHDALADVIATLELARLVKRAQPRLYDYVYKHRSKHKAASLINLPARKPFFHVSSRLPRENGYAALMMPLATHPTNKNAIIAVNLMSDPEPLATLKAEEIRQRLFTPNTELPEGTQRIPLKGIHINRCPIVATPKLLDKAAAERLGIDIALCDKHWQQLQKTDFSEKIVHIFAKKDFPPYVDSEQALYEGFLGDHDRKLLSDARKTLSQSPANKSPVFHDERYNDLLFHYRSRYAPASLSDAEKKIWAALKQERLIEGKAGYLTLANYFKEVDAIETSGKNLALAQALRAWGKDLLAELTK